MLNEPVIVMNEEAVLRALARMARELVDDPKLEGLIAAMSWVASTGLLFFWHRSLPRSLSE